MMMLMSIRGPQSREFTDQVNDSSPMCLELKQRVSVLEENC